MFKLNFFKSKPYFSINHLETNATKAIAFELFQCLPKNFETDILFICIGTDRSTGDSLGPLVGSSLYEKTLPKNFRVFGSLEDPIHAVNLQDKLDYILSQYNQPFVIGIDACLGQVENVGHIQIKKEPLKPGAGVNKTLPEVGQMHITGIVNVSGFMEFYVLQNTRLHLVMNLAKTISDSIVRAGQLYHIEQKRYKNTVFLYNEENITSSNK